MRKEKNLQTPLQLSAKKQKKGGKYTPFVVLFLEAISWSVVTENDIDIAIENDIENDIYIAIENDIQNDG